MLMNIDVSLLKLAMSRISEKARFITTNRKAKTKSLTDQKKRFDSMLFLAKCIIEDSKDWPKDDLKSHPIYNYIKMLGRKTQGEMLLEAFSINFSECGNNKNTSLRYYEFISKKVKVKNADGFEFIHATSLLECDDRKESVDISRSLILPWPWNYDRIINAMSKYVPWIEDENHQITLWEPFGIYWVDQGNHSITSAILNGSGTITHVDVCNACKLLENIYTDGLYYYNTYDKSVIAAVENVEFAAIYEIGRLIELKYKSKGAKS